MRQLLVDVLRDLCYGDPVSGVEVGVHEGKTSEFLLKEFPQCAMLFVDPWQEWSSESSYYKTHRRTGKDSADKWIGVEASARRRINTQCLINKAESSLTAATPAIYQGVSVDAAKGIPDLSVDFVFIDANHSEESVLEDIRAWLPKCKRVMCGHDYGGRYQGVKKAVDHIFGGAEVITPGRRLWFVRQTL